ncbi:hypothetical protein UY3_15586 [Chelonia mydas]|uniref:LIM zinc-binding domain-containing protein n=1 Tax=Chelonia mydas TaxID=8469 RepID=M7BGI8_CHEMY|nr:hypothetical protein UY3_15586 [Chelonia mydas]
MMSLGVSKGGVIPPSEEDRKKIIRQMKVRTTLKGDKSWIYPQNSDNEEEMKRSSLGVFTRTIEKTSPESTFYSNGTQKRAPFNVRQISVDSDEEKTAFSPDEHKKRTEAANSVLRRTASRERSYVLSAAKKSNGSPTQEVPPFIAKSFDTDSKSQATRSWSESTSQISSYTEISDKVDEEKPVETSPAEATTTKPTLATGRRARRVHSFDLPGSDLRAFSIPFHTVHFPQSSPRSRDIPAHPTDARFTAPGYLGDAECDPKRSVPGYEEGRPTREVRYESTRATEHKEPELNVTRSSPSSGDSSAVIQEVRHRVPMHLDDEEFDFNRSSSHSTESNVTTTDPRHGIPVCMEDGELDPERLFPLKGNTEDAENENISATQSEPPTTRKHTEPDENMAQLPSASSERISMSTASFQYHSPSAMGHKSNPSTASKGILFVKEYVNSRELSPTPHYSSDSLIDLSDIERASYLHSSASQRSCEGVCTYCGREIRDCPKIMIEHLNVYCHEYCFRCGICHKAMGDLLDKIFIHRDIVHCDQCYEKLF